MAGEIAAKRHAQAVFEIALQDSTLDNWRAELDLMAGVFADQELVLLMDDPKIRFEDKIGAITKGLGDVSQKALNLAKLLTQKRQAKIMPQIAEEYSILVDRQQGIEHAEVTTASPIDKATEENFQSELAKITGSKILLKSKVDPNIIGGFVARVGDKVIDGSVRSRLQALKQNIIQAG